MRNLRPATWPVGVAAILLSLVDAHAARLSDFVDFSAPALPGRLYVPPEAADATEPRPFILFLHGAGETGINNASQVNGNIDNLLNGAKSNGAFLYAPQATTFTWADVGRTANVMSMIDQAISQYNVDPDRLYVTGLSMGGGGVWNMMNRYADRFAAGTPIAAVSPGSDFDPDHLVGKPTWAFHARDDGTVSSVASRSVVNRILTAAEASPITYPGVRDLTTSLVYANEPVGLQFSEWPRGGHGIWGAVYDAPDLYDWMFSKTLAPPLQVDPAGGGQVVVTNNAARLPIADQSGIAIPAGTGFVAVGAFDLPDSQIAQTNVASLHALANSFTQFGLSLPIGLSGLEGLFSANMGAPLAAADPLLGKNVYLVVGDGRNIESSKSLFVFRSNDRFATESPAFLSNIALDGDLERGEILLGKPGTVFANRQGGFRPGILAAAVDVPEPSTVLLALLCGVGVFCVVSRRIEQSQSALR